MTRNAEFLVYVAGLTGAQFAALWAFRRALRRELAAPDAGFRPPVSVIVPCKGAPAGLGDSVRALLAQDYPAAEFMFVVPTEGDRAFAAIRAAVAGDARARVLASNAVPTRCSGKALDILFALERTSARSEVLVFADADMTVPPGWLADLVAPLTDGETAVATSCMLYVAATPSFWTFLRMTWMAAGLPYFALLGVAAGHSMALSRKDFTALGVADVWSRSLMEDLALASAVRRAGKRVRFVARAMPVSHEECGARDFFALFDKWMFCFRVYDPRVWLGALAACCAHAWIVYWCLRPPFTPRIPALLFAGDAAYLAGVLAVLRAAFPEKFAGLSPVLRSALPFWAALAAAPLWAAYAWQVAASLVARRVRWGGRTYDVRGPQDVAVVA